MGNIVFICLFILCWVQCSNTACLDDDENPVFCEPEFTNIAQKFQASLQANSTCGSYAEETICPYFPSLSSIEQSCEFCDSRGSEERRHPIASITNNKVGLLASSKKSCWISQPGSQKPAMIEINFGKKMEFHYIVMRFCNEPPTNVAIYKSDDYSGSWYPIHYISEDCIGDYGITAGVSTRGIKPTCAKLEKSATSVFGLYSVAQSSGSYDTTDPDIQKKMLSTGFRFIMEGYPDLGKNVSGDEYKFFSLSSVDVGGQCQCYGHSDSCWNDGRRTKCDCQHHTSGFDCDKCEPFYQDIPWQPSTIDTPFECRVCNCNDHSHSCYFDPDVYRANGWQSGGVCTYCEHNTSGRSCETCKDGFYRTPDTLISDVNACSKCDCHPIGSLDTFNCDFYSGQCVCKPGVEGSKCEKCQSGYKISADNDIPCIPIDLMAPDDMLIADRPPLECQEVNSQPCSSQLNKVLEFSAYCGYNTIISVIIEQSQRSQNSIAYRARLIDHHDGPGSLQSPIYLNVNALLVDCDCITMTTNNEYILFVNWPLTGSGNLKMLSAYDVKNTDAILKKKSSLTNKVNKFKVRKANGKC